MNQKENFLKEEEKTILNLRRLYKNYGYAPFKMAKFEEYDLYARNKDFLLSDQIITFTDTNGRLMALKPDVTLSIIKNVKEKSDSIQKLYYTENVYRVSKDTHTYKEFMQTGLECIGDIDHYHMCEVLLLAYKSLELISSRSILTLSHMGIVSSLLEELHLNGEQEKIIFQFINEKNAHGIEKMCGQTDMNQEIYKKLMALISAYGSIDSVLKKLQHISTNAKMDRFIEELKSIGEILKLNGCEHVQMDFSVINGMNYYNGIVFQGFIDGIPTAVLSGGRYDKLLQGMGKQAGAIGFALYLNRLEYLPDTQRAYDVDVLVLYSSDKDIKAVTETVEALNKNGRSAQVQKQIPEKLRYRKFIQIKDGRITSFGSDH